MATMARVLGANLDKELARKAQQRRLKAIAKLAEVKTINEDLRLEVILKLAGGSPADVESILDSRRVALFRCDDAAWDDGEELRALMVSM